MNHETAIKTHAALRYVRDEMTAAEHDSFEDHYFGCPLCAAQVDAAERQRERFLKRKAAFRILEISLPMFAERGYSKLEFREVAPKALVTEGAIFRWFGSKLGLLIQTIRCKLFEATDPADLATDALGKLVPIDRKALENAVREQVELALRLSAKREE